MGELSLRRAALLQVMGKSGATRTGFQEAPADRPIGSSLELSLAQFVGLNQSENTNVMSRNFSTGRFVILRCISEMFTPSLLTTLASATVIGAEKKNSVKPNAIRIAGTIKIA
jgi:hypothetical protein